MARWLFERKVESLAASKRKYPYKSKLGPDQTSGDGRRANGILKIPLEEILKEASLFPNLGIKVEDSSQFGPPVPLPLTQSFSGMGFIRSITHTQTGKPIRPFQADTYIAEVTDAKYQNRQLFCDLTHIDFAFRYAVCVVRKCGALEPKVGTPNPNHIASIHISSEDFSPLWYSTKLLLHLFNAKHFIESGECSNDPSRLMCELIGFGLTLAESQFRENYLELVERENQSAERDSKAVEAMKSTRTQIAESRRKKIRGSRTFDSKHPSLDYC